MKLWRRDLRQAPTPEEFETQQQRLQRLSGDVLKRYRASLDAEVKDSEDVAEVYGLAFANRDNAAQAQIVVTMAASMLQVPNAQINVVLPDRQVTVAQIGGLEDPVVPRDDSFCQHVIATGEEVAVTESANHPLVCDTSFARSGQIVSYLGVPIANRAGVIIGVLCVWDDQVRSWGPADVGILMQLSFILTRSTNTEPVQRGRPSRKRPGRHGQQDAPAVEG